jgi:hypothetical protein
MSCFGISHFPQFTDVNGIVRENIMEFPEHVRREIKILARKNMITSVQKELDRESDGNWTIRYIDLSSGFQDEQEIKIES